MVDDASADGTAERAESLAAEIPVRVLRRPGRLGLATAVLDGWATARGEVLGVLDADLQHPPETLRALTAAILRGADLAIGSRYVPGGGTSDWTWVRRLISRTATHMAATVLPLKLAVVGDPMSGMFMVRASALRNAQLNPLGYKILLEVIAKAHYNKLVEVPYVFQERERGASKLGRANIGNISGTWRGWPWGPANFWAGCATAWWRLLGALIDVGSVLRLDGAGTLACARCRLPVAIEAALLSNFVCSEAFTFRTAEDLRFQTRSFWAGWRDTNGFAFPARSLNFLVTLLWMAQGGPVLRAAAAGVVAGGALQLTDEHSRHLEDVGRPAGIIGSTSTNGYGGPWPMALEWSREQ